MPSEDLQTAAEARWFESWLKGPTKTTWSELPPQVGSPAPDLQLPDTTGKIRRLSEFWSHGPLLLIFLRHFGCSCLAERWEKLKEEIVEFRKAGAEVVAVSQGEPARTAEVVRRRGYPFVTLSDPSRKSYEDYGLLEGTPAQILHDFQWKPDDRETGMKMITSRRGTERAIVDSPWQLPGEFVISSAGRLLLAHRYQYCEDFPPKTVVIGAIQAAKASE
jgi:peroxiredoxin